MNFKVDQKQMLRDLKGLLSIASTNGDAGAIDEMTPLGKNINDAIDYMLAVGKRFGFETQNLDGCCGIIDMGEGEEMVGVLVHIDTVPVGEGWSVDPFDGTVIDGKVYGRGTNDDKGPAMVALYAMKALKDSGVPVNKRIRLIIGGDEESGTWRCMDRYKETEIIPDYAFSPDASYPVIFAEKGILKIQIHNKTDVTGEDMTLKAGKQINIVPDFAEAEVQGRRFTAKGRPAHAMEPQNGVNALLKLGCELKEAGIVHPFLELLDKANVEGFNIAISDEISGELTINPAIGRVDAQGSRLECDIRYPVTADVDDIVGRIRQSVDPVGYEVDTMQMVPPLYVKKDSPLVQTLLGVYRDITGDRTEPIAIGGGTYARAFDNAVAFGVLFPDEPDMCHQVDEYWSVEDMMINLQIIAGALAALGVSKRGL